MKIQTIKLLAPIVGVTLYTVTNWDTYSSIDLVTVDGNYYFKKSGALFVTDLAVALYFFSAICVETKIGDQLLLRLQTASATL
jgi:hypothetical protein